MKSIIIFLFIFSTTANAESLKDMRFGTLVVDEIRTIYDGDTFRANLADMPDIIGERMSIRISGIDTPEMRGKCPKEKDLARKAKKFTVQMLRNGTVIELRNTARGKYFRILADVDIDGVNLGKELIKNNLAVPYHGGKKINWCN